MKRVMLYIVVLCLSVVFLSCATMKTYPPPPGCEGAISYKIPGFIPYGVGGIRLAVVGLCSVNTKIELAVIQGVTWAYMALQEQLPRTFIRTFIEFVDPIAKYLPGVSALLKKALKYFSDDNLTTCDRDVLASLAQNIYHDLTGGNIWDEASIMRKKGFRVIH